MNSHKCLLALLLTVTGTACSPTNFKSSKAAVIAKTSVLSGQESNEDDASGRLKQPSDSGGGNASASGTEDTAPGGVIQGSQFPVVRVCSNAYSSGLTPVAKASLLQLRIKNANGVIVCQSSDTTTLKIKPRLRI
ncbi:MAG: hypothetical protein AB7F86_13080 [Bdellovibrionales bacterium]